MTSYSNSNSVGLHVRLTPNARRNEITGFTGDVLQVKIAAPPVKGKANEELINYLSKVLGIKKSNIIIVKGQTSRNKVLSIEGMSKDEMLLKIPSLLI